MTEVSLPLELGRPVGSRPSRRLRREGKVPGTVYGLGEEAVNVTVAYNDLRNALSTEAGANAVLHLRYGDGEQLALIKELQRHPLRRGVTHVDFIRVDPEIEVQVEVPLRLVGEAAAVAEVHGIVDQDIFELSMMSKPRSIPNEILVDVSDLRVGSTITVGDLELPEGITCLADSSVTVVSGIITRSALMSGDEEESEEEEEETEPEEGED